MRRARNLFALLALTSVSLGLSACGGSDDHASSADVTEITDAIVTSGTTDTAAECTELETQRFVEQIQSEKGEPAVASCKQPGDSNAENINVGSVAVDTDQATAEATITGGSFDGQTLKISLVKQGGGWKLDHIDGFQNFDRDKVAAALSASIDRTGNFTARQSDCISTELAKLDDQKIQDILLSGDSNQLIPVVRPCTSR